MSAVEAPPWIDAPALVAEAERRHGLRLADVPPLLAPLAAELAALGPRLHFLGKQRIRERLLEALGWCLRIDAARLPPSAPLPQAVFIVAPFRSGTTFLHRLLARDPRWRTVMPWESMYAPQGEPGTLQPADERAARLRADLQRLYRHAPALERLHRVDPDAAEECFPFLESSLCSPSLLFLAPLHGYLEALARVTEAQWDTTYARYRAHLQALHQERPAARWLLKCPPHLWSLGALRRAFPDAVFVHIQREPVAVATSLCRLIEAHHTLALRQVDRNEVGRLAAAFLAPALRRAALYRRTAPAGREVDLAFDALVADPAAALQRITEAAGLPAEPTDRAAAHAGATPDTKGGHGPALEDFGLDRAEVRAWFGNDPDNDPRANA